MVVAVRRPRIPQMLAQGMRPPPKPRSPFGNGASVWGGMPSYIANAVKDEPMAPMGGDFEALMAELNASAPKPKITVRPPTDAPYTDNSGYAMPEGGVTEAEMMSAPVLPNGGWAVEPKAQEQQRSPALDIFSQKYEKPKPGWGDALGLVGGALMDLDGTLGSGNMARAQDMMQQRADESRAEFEQRRQEQIMQLAAQGDETALAMLDPLGNRAFQYGVQRDGVQDARYLDETQYGRGRDALADSRYIDERDYGRTRDQVGDTQWEREFSAAEAARKAAASSAGRYGVTPVFGRDANGNRVILQTNNAGGVDMAALPEGITLEDDYSRTYSRETAKNDAKIAAYETTAGRALSAFETKADELMGQIDTAIEQTDGWNTGVLGQFIAAGDLDGTLDAIGAKAMLSELVAIKEQGGTLGALSDSEGKALRDAAVNVARSQSEKQLDANLRAYRLQVERAKMVLKQAFEEQYVNGAQASRGGAPAATAARVGPSGQPPPPGFE